MIPNTARVTDLRVIEDVRSGLLGQKRPRTHLEILDWRLNERQHLCLSGRSVVEMIELRLAESPPPRGDLICTGGPPWPPRR